MFGKQTSLTDALFSEMYGSAPDVDRYWTGKSQLR